MIDARSQQWPFVPVPDAGREPMDLAVVPVPKGTRSEMRPSSRNGVPESRAIVPTFASLSRT